jgi:hypothetical protein
VEYTCTVYLNTRLKAPAQGTSWCRGEALDVYSGGPQFGSWLNTSYPDWWFSWFFSNFLGKCQDTTPTGPWPLPSKSFPIHHLSIILLCSAIWSRYWNHHQINHKKKSLILKKLILFRFCDSGNIVPLSFF